MEKLILTNEELISKLPPYPTGPDFVTTICKRYAKNLDMLLLHGLNINNVDVRNSKELKLLLDVKAIKLEEILTGEYRIFYLNNKPFLQVWDLSSNFDFLKRLDNISLTIKYEYL